MILIEDGTLCKHIESQDYKNNFFNLYRNCIENVKNIIQHNSSRKLSDMLDIEKITINALYKNQADYEELFKAHNLQNEYKFLISIKTNNLSDQIFTLIELNTISLKTFKTYKNDYASLFADWEMPAHYELLCSISESVSFNIQDFIYIDLISFEMFKKYNYEKLFQTLNLTTEYIFLNSLPIQNSTLVIGNFIDPELITLETFYQYEKYYLDLFEKWEWNNHYILLQQLKNKSTTLATLFDQNSSHVFDESSITQNSIFDELPSYEYCHQKLKKQSVSSKIQSVESNTPSTPYWPYLLVCSAFLLIICAVNYHSSSLQVDIFHINEKLIFDSQKNSNIQQI